MSFEPPRCPNPDCDAHTHPKGRFFRLRGFYWPQCRPEPVQRFRCRFCRRSFSVQTFRADCGDRKPEVNVELIRLASSGMGVRQSGRLLDMSPNGVLHKQRKLARVLELLHENYSACLPQAVASQPHGATPEVGVPTFQFDEEESYEALSIRPLTVPILIERETWFVVATAVGPIRRLARAGSKRRRLQERDEQLNGRRRDESRACVREVLLGLRTRLPEGMLVLQSDRKSSYKTLIEQLFAGRASHQTQSGKAKRTVRNLLFPINTTIAMSRDNCSRLRRKSWLVSKTADGLRAGLAIFVAYRNYVRKRFNRDEPGRSPAAILGLVARALSFEELIRWRQDWGALSPDPLRSDGRTRPTAGRGKPVLV